MNRGEPALRRAGKRLGSEGKRHSASGGARPVWGPAGRDGGAGCPGSADGSRGSRRGAGGLGEPSGAGQGLAPGGDV